MSTEDGTIEYSNECGLNNVTDVPDYFTYYEVDDTGSYEMKLKNLDTGYEIKDSFEVRESLPFDIERMGPTRINPTAEYEMTFKIKANQDFSGEVIEKVPASFSISEQEGMRQEINGEEKSLIWKADWKEGEIYELTYQFDAPDISPYLYLLGPLETGQFKETRQWQIASDRTTWTEACGTATKSACTCSGGPKKCGGLGQCSYVCPDYTAYHVQAAVNTCVYTKTGTCGTASCTLVSQCLANFTCAYLSGNCSYTCSTNYEDCDLSSANGCECDLTANTCVGTTCTPAGITVSGTVYADEASTVWPHCDSSTANISLAVNGVMVQTTHCHTSPDGTYSFTSVTVAANQEVAVFMNATDKGIAATVAKDASTTPITLNPREGRVWVKEETGAANITNTLLHKSDKAVASCGNVPYTISDVTNALTVDDTYKIVIETGKTFAPDGNVTTPAMEITGTYTASSYTLILSAAGTVTTPCTGDAGSVMPLCVAGTFTASTDTVQYSLLTGGQYVAGLTYNNLTLSNTSNTDTAAGAITVNTALTTTSGGTLDMATYQLLGAFTPTNGGTLKTSNTTSPAIPASKTWTGTVQFALLTGGQYVPAGTYTTLTFSNTSGTDTATGAITATTLNTTASGILNMVTYNLGVTNVTNNGTIRTQGLSATPLTTGKTWAGTVQYDATTGAQTIMAGTYAILTLSNTSGTDTASGDITVSNVFTTGAGIFDASSRTITLSGTGTPFVKTGTFTASTSTVKYTGDGDTNITVATYKNLEFSPTITDNRIYTGAGAITVGGTLNINPNATAKSLTFNLGGTTSVTGAITIQRTGTANSYLDTTLAGHHSLTASSISIQTASYLTANSSTITLTASSGQPLTESGSGYFDDGTSNVVFTGDGNVTIGDIDAGVEYYDLTFSPTITANRIYSSNGNIEIGHNLDINPDASSAYSLTFNLGGYFYASSGTITIQRTNSATSVLDTTITGYSLNASVINIQAGGTLTANGSTIYIYGTSGTPFAVNGTFNYGTSVFYFTGNGDITIAATTYYTLKFGPALGLSTNRTYTGGGAITVNNNMEIYPTGSGTESLTFNLGGTTSITGSLTIRRAGSVTSILNTTISNHSLTVGSLSIWIGGTLTGNASALDSNGDVTIDSGGTLTSTSVNFNVGGSWSNSASGVFAHSNGTVIFDAVTTGKTISDGGDAFYQIQFTGANGGWTYTDGCSSGPHQVTVNAASGTATFINAKTGDGSHDPTVTTGTLNVDWYLGVHVADAVTTTTHIDTGVADITISENSSSSWLSGWSYRKSHVINSATGAGTNYQVQIIVHKTTGSDSGSDVYVGTNVRDDFGDVRFTDNDGTTLLDYWMESYTSGTSAIFWVEVTDSLESSNQTIYVYYGKSDVTTTSNGTNTFPTWFDDFSTNTISNYTSDGGTWSVDTGNGWLVQSNLDCPYIYQIFATGLNLTDTSVLTSIYSSVDSPHYDTGIVMRAASGEKCVFAQDSGALTEWDIFVDNPSPSSEVKKALTDYPIANHGSAWHRFRADIAGDAVWFYWDDVQRVSYDGTLALTSGSCGLATYEDPSSGQWNFDYLAVRKFVYPEPAHSTWGDEDSGGGAAATVWRYDSDWGSGASSKTTGTDSNGDNPQPISAGAIRIREYSNTSGVPTYYLYNLKINWVTQTGTNYGEYDYYADYGSNYLTSTANSGANKDAAISVGWYRATVGTMNAVGTINEPPINGSWYCGMLTGLSVSINSYSVNLGAITPGAAPTDSLTPTIITVTTSATNGYVITAWSASDPAMTCSSSGVCSSETIFDWTGTNASPTTWSPGFYGFGYSTDDDTLVAGEGDDNRFLGPKFAGFSHSGSGDPVADRSSTECPCSGQENNITYRIAASPTQRAGPYSATIVYIVTVQY